MKIKFITFGCKVNAGEDQLYLSQLIEQGFLEAKDIDEADIVVINTCAVTEHAAKKSAQYIAKLRKSYTHLKIIVTGCLTEDDSINLKEYGADIIVTNGSKADIIDHILNMTDGLIKAGTGSFAGGAVSVNTGTKTRAFFKIQDGCNAFCTYCIIPRLRGKPKSMKRQDVISGFKKLISSNYKEIVLVGIHIGLYGKDTNDNLTSLLKELVSIEGDFRIRLTSIEINEITDELLYLIKDSNKICPHLHIPLQSGSNKILKAGFPNENDDDFNESLNTLKLAGTEFYHAFAYSERKGTPACLMDNKVDIKVREERSKILRAQGDEMLLSLQKKSIGKTYRVLSEKGNKGHSSNYMLIHYDKDTEPNQFINVLITKIKNGKLYGKVI